MTDDLKARLLATESSGKQGGRDKTCWHRNPDGPEAAAYISLLEKALGEAREALKKIAGEDTPTDRNELINYGTECAMRMSDAARTWLERNPER